MLVPPIQVYPFVVKALADLIPAPGAKICEAAQGP